MSKKLHEIDFRESEWITPYSIYDAITHCEQVRVVQRYYSAMKRIFYCC